MLMLYLVEYVSNGGLETYHSFTFWEQGLIFSNSLN